MMVVVEIMLCSREWWFAQGNGMFAQGNGSDGALK
jgi:hypothetical protein